MNELRILEEGHPRKCFECGDGMSEGYLINSETYCSDKCRRTIMSDKEWEKHYTDDGDDCWTSWELEDADEIFDDNGNIIKELKMTIEITKKEGDLIMLNYPHQLYASVEKSNGNYDLEVPDVDKFRKFLCNEFNLDDLDCDKNWNLKSIISKLDKMKQNTNKLNWNGLTDKQQEFTERIIDREIFTLCNELVEYASINDDYIEFDNSYDEENDEYCEIFQYFIVSEWLYDQLFKIGGCVAEFKGFYIWGRCDFGQSMDMNSELKQIAKNIVK